MALDDLSMTNGACRPTTSCDFEAADPSACGWVNYRTSLQSIDWIQQTGGANGGPKIDHTIGKATGHFLYANFVNASAATLASLSSEDLAPIASDRCLTFWLLFINGKKLFTRIFFSRFYLWLKVD